MNLSSSLPGDYFTIADQGREEFGLQQLAFVPLGLCLVYGKALQVECQSTLFLKQPEGSGILTATGNI